MSQISESLITQVIEAHSECEKLAFKTGEAMRAQVHSAWRAGQYLISLQEQCKREGRNFTPLFSNRGAESETNFTFTYETGRIYVKLFTAYPEGIDQLSDQVSTIKDALLAAGVIERRERGTQNARGPMNWLSKVVAGIMSACSTVEKEVEKEPIEEWDKETCERIVEEGEQFTGYVQRAKNRLQVLGGAA